MGWRVEKKRKERRAILMCRMAEHFDSLFLFVATPLANETVWNSLKNAWEHHTHTHTRSQIEIWSCDQRRNLGAEDFVCWMLVEL